MKFLIFSKNHGKYMIFVKMHFEPCNKNEQQIHIFFYYKDLKLLVIQQHNLCTYKYDVLNIYSFLTNQIDPAQMQVKIIICFRDDHTKGLQKASQDTTCTKCNIRI